MVIKYDITMCHLIDYYKVVVELESYVLVGHIGFNKLVC